MDNIRILVPNLFFNYISEIYFPHVSAIPSTIFFVIVYCDTAKDSSHIPRGERVLLEKYSTKLLPPTSATRQVRVSEWVSAGQDRERENCALSGVKWKRPRSWEVNTVPQIQPATRKEHFEMAEKPQWKMAFRLCLKTAEKKVYTQTHTHWMWRSGFTTSATKQIVIMTYFRVPAERDLLSEHKVKWRSLLYDHTLERKYHIKLRAQWAEQVIIFPTWLYSIYEHFSVLQTSTYCIIIRYKNWVHKTTT